MSSDSSDSADGGTLVWRGEHPFRPYRPERVPPDQVVERAARVFQDLDARRSVRMFSTDPVPRAAIEDLLRAASTAPSGAHRQPWTFVAISDPDLKRQIREAAEAEERRNYESRMPPDWLAALAPLGTDADKPHLEDAPWLVVVFAQKWSLDAEGERVKHYYVRESVGMACGMLVAAAHQAGLATLTHTPSPMAFLQKLLGRPDNEQAYVVMPLGYPSEDCLVPDLERKALDAIAVFRE